MEQKKRMKLCAHCEGQVETEAKVCPFCGNGLVVGNSSLKEGFAYRKEGETSSLSPEETVASLYPPPYSSSKSNEPARVKEEVILEDVKEENGVKPIWPILLFSLGVNLLLLGLFTFFFSQKGEFVVKWDAHFWFAYFLLSAPLIYFGYKGISR